MRPLASGLSNSAVALALVGMGGAGAWQWVNHQYGPEALGRMAKAYSVVWPAFLQYRFIQLFHEELPARFGLPVDRVEVRRRYQSLHQYYAPAVFDSFLGLRGFYIKTGQLIANNLGNAAPLHWQRVFEPMLDDVPPKPFEHVRATVEAELGRPLEAVFTTFDPTPLASASIGQVHRATLREGGRAVVVKVMDPSLARPTGPPEVEARFRGDITSAKAFVAWALPEHLPPLTEIEKQFANEFDYRREAAQLGRVRENLARGGFSNRIIVPEPIIPLCTKRVLTMEEVPRCEKLACALKKDFEGLAAALGRPVGELVEEDRRLNEEALVRGEVRCGPSAAQLDAFIATVQWRNWWGSWVGARPARVPLNHARLMDDLLEVHGHEVLVDGYLNGDPHPGNCLVSYAEEGDAAGGGGARLALVDYGQVKALSRAARLKFARLIVALEAGDKRGTSEAMLACGMETRDKDPEVMYEYGRLYFDRCDKSVTGGLHIQAYLDALERRDPQTRNSEDYVMVARCSLMLRGLGSMLNQHRSAAAAWAPIARKVLREEAGEEV
jgi:aarF domain-containing kinase